MPDGLIASFVIPLSDVYSIDDLILVVCLAINLSDISLTAARYLVVVVVRI